MSRMCTQSDEQLDSVIVFQPGGQRNRNDGQRKIRSITSSVHSGQIATCPHRQSPDTSILQSCSSICSPDQLAYTPTHTLRHTGINVHVQTHTGLCLKRTHLQKIWIIKFFVKSWQLPRWQQNLLKKQKNVQTLRLSRKWC